MANFREMAGATVLSAVIRFKSDDELWEMRYKAGFRIQHGQDRNETTDLAIVENELRRRGLLTEEK